MKMHIVMGFANGDKPYPVGAYFDDTKAQAEVERLKADGSMVFDDFDVESVEVKDSLEAFVVVGTGRMGPRLMSAHVDDQLATAEIERMKGLTEQAKTALQPTSLDSFYCERHEVRTKSVVS